MLASFVVVEGEVPAFIFDNPAKDLGEDGICRPLREKAIALQRRKLLDGAPREICG
jgi:hypothetical protein